MLGEMVRARRKKLGWKQQTLADKAGLAQSYVSMIERGVVTDVSMETLRQLARALGMAAKELMEAAESPPTLEDLREEGHSSEFIEELRNLEPDLSPEARAALIQAARQMRRRSPERNNDHG